MPISSPPQTCPAANDPKTPIRSNRSRWLSACLLLALASAASAQMLARPGWANARLKADPWWQHAIFYKVDSPPDFKALSVRLDALRTLGVDALLLSAPELPPPGINATLPNLDDLDDLLRQSASHGIRVLLTLHVEHADANLSGVARFWLSRGIAGIHIATPPETSPDETQAIVLTVRKLAASAAGQRIVISDLDLAPPEPQSARKPSPRARASDMTAQFQIDVRPDQLGTFDAASLRPLLTQAIAQPNLLLDLRAPGAALADAVAAIAILTRPATLIDSSANLVLQPTPERIEPVDPSAKPAPPPPPPQPPPGTYLPYVPYVPPPKPQAPVAPPKPVPPNPLTIWYQGLTALHHDNAVLQTGSKTFLDFDDRNALVWVNRPASPSPHTPPVVVICNLSASPVQLSLTAAMKQLNLRGFFLRALLRSDNGLGAQDLNSVTLPPFAVYIGELRL
jgi:alpha-glucosidase